ncbi:MAG: hypothetical protein QOE18_357 [Chloroflexota bacterium]|jgi:hypothetical protein|nr:hypothetical protein [Chloroflexota bacterium]
MSLVVAIAASGALITLGSTPAAAASSTQILTGSTSAGVLSISAPGPLTLPTLVAGSSTAATNLGSLTWTDTMNDAVVSSVTLAATNLWHAAGAGLYIPWADFTIIVDPTPTANVNNSGAAATVPAGSPYVLAGTATTDFATYSTPITLATASATSEGSWTQASNQIIVAVPGNTTPGTLFTATIQYTVTG